MPTATDTSQWSIRDLKGPREHLIESVQAAATVPDAAKAFLIEAIAAMPASAKFIRLDAHCARFKKHDGKTTHDLRASLAEL